MLLAEFGDTSYNIVLFLHILAMFVAFSPAFVHPFLDADTRDLGPARQAIVSNLAKRGMRIYSTALIVGGLLGFGVAGMSDDGSGELRWSVSDGWVLTAVVLWIAMLGVLHGMIIKGEKAIGEGDEAAVKTVTVGGQLVTVMYLITLYLMVFKPGA